MQKMIDSIRQQYRITYMNMAQGGTWHVYRFPDSDRLLLAQENSDWIGEAPPIMVKNVQGMTEAAMIQKIQDKIRS